MEGVALLLLILLDSEVDNSLPAFLSKPLISEAERHEMSQDAKRSVPGPLPVKPNSDDRKPSPAVTTSTGKRVIIKSADMFQDMQKEAVEIAIGVSSLSPNLHC